MKLLKIKNKKIRKFIIFFKKSKKILSERKEISTGVDIILGDWGSGKTHYFNNVYVKKYKSFRLEKLSCFSYSREEFIKQLITIKFWNRWLSLNGLLAGYILHNWHKMLPKNMLIFIDDLERLPCDEYMANDFIGIIEELKKHNRVVIACSPQDIKQDVISRYLEKLVDYFPHQINLEKQIKSEAIINVIYSCKKYTNDIKTKQSINLLADTLSKDDRDSDIKCKKNRIEGFAFIFTSNYKEAINLRSIEKVFQAICEYRNADKIIKVIVDIISQDIPKDITFDNIKSYYRYLKIKEKIEIYLVAYELLFTYPKLSSIVNDFHKSNQIIDHNQKPSYANFEEKNTEKLDLSKYIKYKDVGKINFLVSKVDFKKLNFGYISKLLKDIDSLSTVNDDDLLRDLVLGNSIEIEKYFTCKDLSSEVYGFCKEVSLYVIAKKYLDKEIYFPFTSDYYSLSKNIKDSFSYLQRIKDFWVEVGDYFIRKEGTYEKMIKKYCDSISWDRYHNFFHYDDMFYILRVLSLVDFYSKQYKRKLTFDHLEGKNLKKWSEKIKRLLNAYEPRKLGYINFLLFELNAINDSTKKEKINNMFSKIDEAYKDFCKRKNKSESHDSRIDFQQSDSNYTNLRDNLIEAFESIFTKEIESFKEL